MKIENCTITNPPNSHSVCVATLHIVVEHYISLELNIWDVDQSHFLFLDGRNFLDRKLTIFTEISLLILIGHGIIQSLAIMKLMMALHNTECFNKGFMKQK